jgi:chromosome segregation ATPase
VATLVYSDADGIDRTLAMGRDPIVVGRAQECAIRSQDPRVSRMHARFFVAEGNLWVEDLGSSNGIYVGPQKVQRAPVPIGEIVLVGSLMIRLLPPSGTMPPPMGLHGTLAQWLEMERKARAGVEEERDAFARRVNEIHSEANLIRDALLQQEQDTAKVREELDRVRKQATQDLEAARLEAAKAREAKIIAETQAGITTAEKLAEADMQIAELRGELSRAKAAAASNAADAKLKDQADAILQLTGRAEKAEKDLAAAQIRAQGAERDLAGVNDKTAALEQAARDSAEKLVAAETRASDAAIRLHKLGGAEAEMTAAKREREEARVRAQTADTRVAEALQRAEEAENRGRAADTMAKAMAKDVAEALRRAVDADTRSRGVSRELDGAHRRAEAAEKRDAERQLAQREAERRATEAEAKLPALEQELTAKLEAARAQLVAKGEAIEKELRGKLEQTQRELAAERSTAMALVDRKTQLERELSEVRTQLAGVQHRLELTEIKTGDYETQLSQLEDKIQDLEAGAAVEHTASQSAVGEARASAEKLEAQLVEAKAAAKTALKTAAALERRIDGLEEQARAASAAYTEAHAAAQAAEQALEEARARIAELEGDHQKLVTAEQRALEAEGRLDPLQAKADAADLAIGRASALQRQLDEALQKLSWYERDGAPRVRPNDDSEQRIKDVEARAKEIEARAKEVAERIVEAERRARDSQSQLGLAQEQVAAYEHKLSELQREVDAAENVRQFAASTEREIAQLQRDLRESKAKLAQLTLERDRFESQLRDVREDSETKNRFAPPSDPDATAQVDLNRYTQLVARAGELESKIVKLEKEDERLRRQLGEAEARAAAQRRAQDEEPTSTGKSLPLEFAEHLSVLEESIDSLRANMRAASDETAMMDQTESVVTVASAVSQAAEHVERARDALRLLTAMVK